MTTSSKPLGSYADLLKDLAALEHLAEPKRQELIAATRFMADKVVGLGAAAMIDLEALNQTLSKVSAATFGLKKASLQNIRSRFRAALKATGRPVMPGKHVKPVSPAWAAAMALVPTKKRARPISRLAHFASERGWLPEEIDDARMAEYEAALKQSLTSHAKRVYRNTCRALNDFAEGVDGWPTPPVAMPDAAAPKSFDWISLPDHLTAEADALFEAKRKSLEKDPSLVAFGSLAEFAAAQDLVGGRPWSAATVDNNRYGLRRHLSVLVKNGWANDVATLRDALHPDLVFRALKCTIDGDGTLKPMHFRIAAALTAIAPRVGVPETELLELRRLEMFIHKELNGNKRGLSEKSTKVLSAVGSPDKLRALFRLPLKLMELVEADETGDPEATARTVRTAVAIEILIMTVLRMKNLVGLQLDKHFLNWLDPSAKTLDLSIPAESTKGGKEIASQLKGASAAFIRKYVTEYRPLLAGAESSWLFPGTKGDHLDQSTLAGQIQKAVLTHVGVKLHPHAFRHIGAKTLLDAYPTAHQTASTLLSHSSVDITMKHYTAIDQVKAVQVYDEVVDKVRADLI